MLLAGTQEDVRTGPPIKTFGGDDLGDKVKFLDTPELGVVHWACLNTGVTKETLEGGRVREMGFAKCSDYIILVLLRASHKTRFVF